VARDTGCPLCQGWAAHSSAPSRAQSSEAHVVKGFKDFLLRGNVVDLAVAVVIGTAFAAVIKTFIDSFVQPIINAAGSSTSPALGFFLRDNDAKTFVNIGAIISAIIYFVVVVPVNNLMERRKRGEEPEVAAPTEDIVLLQEIRDLLRQRSI
jgi:large conductance mechanosensitive channel